MKATASINLLSSFNFDILFTRLIYPTSALRMNSGGFRPHIDKSYYPHQVLFIHFILNLKSGHGSCAASFYKKIAVNIEILLLLSSLDHFTFIIVILLNHEIILSQKKFVYKNSNKFNRSPSQTLNQDNPSNKGKNITYYSFNTFLLLLRCGDVESNPGPARSGNFNVISYNINGGMSIPAKQKRLKNNFFCFDKNHVIMLQETHLTGLNEFSLKARWPHQFTASHFTNVSAGVLTLYNFDDFDKLLYIWSDDCGRLSTVVLNRNGRTFAFVNVYMYIDVSDSIALINLLTTKMFDIVETHSDVEFILAGDFNVVMTDLDSIERQGSLHELILKQRMLTFIKQFGLCDVKHNLHKNSSIPTFRLGAVMSRLDYFFVASSIVRDTDSYSQNWALDKSDHSAICLSFKLNESITYGIGFHKINTTYITTHKDEINLYLSESISESDEITDPRIKWDYVKMKIRMWFENISKNKMSNLKGEIKSLSDEYNLITNRLIKLQSENSNHSITKINQAICDLNKIDKELDICNTKLSENLLFRSKAQYVEKAEKSNKYFLNLINRQSKQNLITSVIDDGRKIESNVIEYLTEYFKNVYSNHDGASSAELDSLLDAIDLPKLEIADSLLIDSPLTLIELESVLKTCKDSCPGIDGIPYSFYKSFWAQVGPLMLNSWNHSVNINSLTIEQTTSIISLLQKPGKEIGPISNLRPISLSNCDI